MDYFDYRSQKMEGAKVMTESSAQLGSRHLIQTFAEVAVTVIESNSELEEFRQDATNMCLLELEIFEENILIHPF